MNKIRKIREQRHWSQEHLAKATGLSIRTIQRAESGKSVSKESLLCLSAVLETDLAEQHPPQKNKVILSIVITGILILGGMAVAWLFYGETYDLQNQWLINYRMFVMGFCVVMGICWSLTGLYLTSHLNNLWRSLEIICCGLTFTLISLNFYPFIQYPFDQYSAAMPFVVLGILPSMTILAGSLWLSGDLMFLIRGLKRKVY